MRFNEQYIREYLKYSDVLAVGVSYYLERKPELPREQAEEKALKYTLKQCRRRYRRDRLDGEAGHRAAFAGFDEDVHDGWYFCPKDREKEVEKQRRKKEEEKLTRRQRENERIRVEALRGKCARKGLDFERENIKQLRRFRLKKRLRSIVVTVLGIPNVLCLAVIIIYSLITRGYSSGTESEAFLFWVFAGWVVTGLPGILLLRGERKDLPDEAFDVLKKK